MRESRGQQLLLASPIRESSWRFEFSSLFFDPGLRTWKTTTDHMSSKWTFCVGQVASGERQGSAS